MQEELIFLLSRIFQTGDFEYQKGMQTQFIYVYQGDGTAARKAAGLP